MPDTKSPGNPRGLYCPSCRGVRLTVRHTKTPCPGVKVRYRKCTTCERILKTQEVVVKLITVAKPTNRKR